MAKRFVDTELDDKPWFTALSCRLKCAVQYIFRKCDSAGIWEPNYVVAAVYIGENGFTEPELLSIDSGQQFEKLPNGKIFVTGFCDFQYGTLSEDCKPHKPVIAKLKKLGLYERVLKGYQKGIDTLQEKDKDKEKEMEQDFGKSENLLPAGIVPDMCMMFAMKNEGYPVDQETDFPAARGIADRIKKWLGLKGDITLPANTNSICRRWGEMVDFIRTDDHYSGYSLTRINKHFQSIAQSFSNGRTHPNKQPASGRQGTSEARVSALTNWGLSAGEQVP